MEEPTHRLHHVSVIAENNGNKSGFNIYLDFSGKREYLTTRRHNGLIYNALKDGVRLDDLQRGKFPARCGCRIDKMSAAQVREQFRHLLTVIDNYLEYREETCFENVC